MPLKLPAAPPQMQPQIPVPPPMTPTQGQSVPVPPPNLDMGSGVPAILEKAGLKQTASGGFASNAKDMAIEISAFAQTLYTPNIMQMVPIKSPPKAQADMGTQAAVSAAGPWGQQAK